MTEPLIQPAERGLLCPPGGFHIDPWRPVDQAVITHAHADHARPGSRVYWAAAPAVPLLQRRLGADADIRGVGWGEPLDFGPVRVSFHPAGHILGSAQIRVAHGDRVWVASGDYKRGADPTCEPFEVVPCDTFITEATFALPVYRWPPVASEVARIHAWWQENAAAGRTSVLFCYALGKAQRVLAELAALTDEPAYLHGAMVPLTEAYREAGVRLLETRAVSAAPRDEDFSRALVLAPPSAGGSTWMRRFRRPLTGFASGWMRIRGNRRRRGHDRGFVLSDHVDWPDLLATIRDTGAREVLTTHGRADELVRYLREHGLAARPLATLYGEGEGEDDEAAA
ncbi:ligase-associated DNA damage response exonuclease [Sediminicurvatus halobius]|uniref:Ligase-associated DNA damage response exonuclease n=1 Tax=Sediminicurvatus halobius TaxID=2182432 RepID=A0A2U2N5F0_9GAMM|nr:ligase-associated DNA damage response exonuclease [Spiribacter halobius]PWG64313.1 ligase-associated DNA damage response exonuclease [Spiribacter halobius]UEX79344.1 ligase-associated DNA damage response exonuclease [Spiribacter halobius]